MNTEERFFLGLVSWFVLFGLLISCVGPNYAVAYLVVSAVIGLRVAIPWPKPADPPPAETIEAVKSPEEVQEEVLRLVTQKVAFLEAVEREHGPEAREKVEELVQQHEFLQSEGGA